MSQPSAASNRRDSFRRHPKQDLRVACHRGPEAAGDNLAVSLLDASQTGLQLAVGQPLESGQEVCISLEGAGQPPVQRTGSVAWCVAEADGSWRIGIRLRQRLPYPALIRLTEL